MKREIPPGMSVYLDWVRLIAAIVVLLTHVWPLVFPHYRLPWPGHSAVVVFFVLSGFVISHAARPEIGLRGYATHRIARLYPVLLAAAVLSIVIASFVPLNIMKYGSSRGSDWQDIGLNLVFLAQSWTDVPLPYVGTVWSLDYEVWYYILFGIWCYRPGKLLLVCAALIAGPKILLLMPVWMLGVLLHRYMVPLERKTAACLFTVSVVAGLAFFWFDAGIKIRELVRTVLPGLIDMAEGSNQFAGDFILGLIVACNFLAAGSLGMRLLVAYEKVIRYLSSFTFSMYIFHLPLTVILWNGLHLRSPIAFFGSLLAGIWVLGMLTERQTKSYRTLLNRMFAGRKPTPVYDLVPAGAGQET